MDTTLTSGDHDRVNPEIRAGLPALAGVLVLSAAHVAVTLGTASGVHEIAPGSFRNEFGHPGWWAAGFLLAIPVGLAARLSPKLTAAFVAAALIPQIALPQLVIERALDAQQGDPLLGLGYLYPILMTPIFAAAGVIGYGLGRKRRPATDLRPEGAAQA